MVDDHRSNKIVIELLGRVNKCGVISPRFDIKKPVKHFLNYLTFFLRTMKNGHQIFYHQDNLDFSF